MEFLSSITLLLLTLVGYSLGAVISVGRKRYISPRLIDLFVITTLWIVALLTRSALGKWLAIFIWFAVAAVVSSILTLVNSKAQSSIQAPIDIPRGSPALRRLWESWKALAAAIGNYQGRLLLAIFYFIIFTPWGLLTRLLGDPLEVKRSSAQSFWRERVKPIGDIEEAQRQF